MCLFLSHQFVNDGLYPVWNWRCQPREAGVGDLRNSGGHPVGEGKLENSGPGLRWGGDDGIPQVSHRSNTLWGTKQIGWIYW